MKLLDERAAAKIYINIKLHFDGQIDMFKSSVGKATIDAVLRRNDAHFFRKAVNEFQKVDVFFDYCSAALLESPQWIGDLVVRREDFDPLFHRLRKVKSNRVYHIRNDLKTMFEDGKSIEYFTPARLVAGWLRSQFNPETVIFMHRAWNVLQPVGNPAIDPYIQRLTTYTSFCSFNTIEEFNGLKKYVMETQQQNQ